MRIVTDCRKLLLVHQRFVYFTAAHYISEENIIEPYSLSEISMCQHYDLESSIVSMSAYSIRHHLVQRDGNIGPQMSFVTEALNSYMITSKHITRIRDLLRMKMDSMIWLPYMYRWVICSTTKWSFFVYICGCGMGIGGIWKELDLLFWTCKHVTRVVGVLLSCALVDDTFISQK